MYRNNYFLFIALSFFVLSTFASPIFANMSEGFTEKDGVAIKRNIPYVKGGGERQQLDLFLPKDFKTAKEPYPVLVWIHGGGWAAGSKDGMDDGAKQAVSNGFAFVSINYRLAPKDRYPAQLEDCKSAIRWLRAHAKKLHLDSDKIGVWGASAGGHLAALLAVTGKEKEFDVGEYLDQSSEIQAACDFFGPKDLVILADYPEYDRFGDAARPVEGLLGAAPKLCKELAEKASPIHYVHKDSAPILILHGTRDELVPIEQSIDFDRAMKKAGADCELVILKGSGHGGPEFMNEKNGGKFASFFLKHLKGISLE